MRVFLTTAAFVVGLALGASAVVETAQAAPGLNSEGIRHVLLISIDGMHSVDFINCAHGVASVNNGASYCPHLAELREHGVNYLDSNTSRPSDSFPGLMSIVSGGLPRSLGVYYDVAYDR
jgi:predicted AlkP superfamily pyrophosphatase or phosphodiesterase